MQEGFLHRVIPTQERKTRSQLGQKKDQEVTCSAALLALMMNGGISFLMSNVADRLADILNRMIVKLLGKLGS